MNFDEEEANPTADADLETPSNVKNKFGATDYKNNDLKEEGTSTQCAC